MVVKKIAVALTFLLTCCCIAQTKFSLHPASPGETVGCFVSNGDNDNLFYSPSIDSKESIDCYFDILQRVYNVKRVYWRAAQSEQVSDYSYCRPENLYLYDWCLWIKHLQNQMGTNEYGVKAAHNRGMEIWGVAALFDHGAQAEVDVSTGFGPRHFEYKGRIEHPEWVPIDKYGIRKMAGPVCFEYPEARKALIDMYLAIAARSGYDGLMFHCYCEHFHLKFADEFGFNAPIVEAYKKRYGVDITKERYDEYALARLRGEYLTQFFRELRQRAKAKGLKVGISLDPQNPDYPQPWLGNRDMLVSGKVKVDWRRYIEEGLIDEVLVYCNGEPYKMIDELLLEYPQKVRVSAVHSSAFPPEYAHFSKQGVIRCIYGGKGELEWGFHSKQEVTALDGNDFIEKLTVLRQMKDNETPADLARIIKATKDPSVYVRRRAVAILHDLKITDPCAMAAAEQCLEDSHNAVRCYAADTIARIGTPSSITKLYSMLDRYNNLMIDLASSWALASLDPCRTDAIIEGMKHPNPKVRAVAASSCASGKYKPDALPALLLCCKDDSAKVRWGAAWALGKYKHPDTIKALMDLIDDENPTVRNMAALSLTTHLSAGSYRDSGERSAALEKLKTAFASYNKTCKSADADWGWRCMGEAIERLGPDGKKALDEFLADESDPVLADHAWQILFMKYSGRAFFPITSAQAQAAYAKHPRLRNILAAGNDQPKSDRDAEASNMLSPKRSK